MIERWAKIEEYDGDYSVSNYGRIRNNETGKLLKPCIVSNGYLAVTLKKQRKRKSVRIHRLVAKAFLANPEGFPQVNHKDENKRNNCIENLEWCDCGYNINHGTAIERRSKKRSKPVAQITSSGKVIKTYDSIRGAERKTGIQNSHISECCRGIIQLAGGYEWRYVE